MPFFPYTLAGGGGSSSIPATFTGIAHETDHESVGLARLLSQYADTPRLRAWLALVLNGSVTIGGLTGPSGVQSIEDLAWELYTERYLHVVEGVGPAAGVNLDIIGRIVGLERNEYSVADAIYIELLKIKILVNRSRGQLPELLHILWLLDFGEPIAAYEYYPCALTTELTNVDADPAGAAIWELVKHAKPGGVRWDFVWSTYSETNVFTISVDPSAETTDNARGTETVGGGAGGRIARSDSR